MHLYSLASKVGHRRFYYGGVDEKATGRIVSKREKTDVVEQNRWIWHDGDNCSGQRL